MLLPNPSVVEGWPQENWLSGFGKECSTSFAKAVFFLSGSNLSDALQAQQGFDWLFFEGFLSRNNKTPP